MDMLPPEVPTELSSAMVWRNFHLDPPPPGEWFMLALRHAKRGVVYKVLIAKSRGHSGAVDWGGGPISLSHPEDVRWSRIVVPVWLP
jgi:hypothetical protein